MSKWSRHMRPGFALITTLWGLALVGIVLEGTLRHAAIATAAARNRVALRAAWWQATGCADRARAAIDSALATPSASALPAAAPWQTLDTVIMQTDPAPDCTVELRSAGERIDINHASRATIQRALELLGDSADVPALDSCYADMAAIRALPEFAGVGGLDELFDVQPGRVDLTRAPIQVLMSIPGLDLEAAQAIVDARGRSGPVELRAIADELPDSARRELLSHFADVERSTTAEPDAWILTSTAAAGTPAMTATIIWRLARSSDSAIVVGWRIDM